MVVTDLTIRYDQIRKQDVSGPLKEKTKCDKLAHSIPFVARITHTCR